MNYIGSKYTLLPFISEAIDDVAGKNLSDKVFCDLFAGTGHTGRHDCHYASANAALCRYAHAHGEITASVIHSAGH